MSGGFDLLEGVRRTLDRASFEADRMMRYNRVRAEAMKLRGQARDTQAEIGAKVLELYRAGQLPLAALGTLAQQVIDLEGRATAKDREAEGIQKEEWQPAEEASTGGDPQPGAASGPAPSPVIHAPPDVNYAPGAPSSVGFKTCPACGMQLRATAAYCSRCGAKQH